MADLTDRLSDEESDLLVWLYLADWTVNEEPHRIVFRGPDGEARLIWCDTRSFGQAVRTAVKLDILTKQ